MLQKPQTTLVALVLISLLSLTLLSCEPSDSAESMFSNYLWRLSNSLELDLDIVDPPADLPRYATRRELLYSIPSININLLEFLKLSRCDLQRHIGQRNSALGKVMKDSQILIYDSVFIQLAQECLTHYEPTDPLYITLATALEHKQRYLPELIWNASFASDEFQQLFSLGAKPFDYTSLSNNPVELIYALEQMADFLAQLAVNRADISDAETAQAFEQALGVIGSSKYIGALRLSMKKVRYTFAQADQLLQVRLDKRPLCTATRPNNAQFNIVNTVFQKFYIGDVQPYIAKLYQRAERVFAAIDQLQARQKTNPDFNIYWQNLYAGPNSEWHTYKQAIEQHRAGWQSLFVQCGALPFGGQRAEDRGQWGG
ncbi:MAG: DUF3080 family protein [Pseudomonadota bacterium]